MGKDHAATEVALVGVAASGLTEDLKLARVVDEVGGVDAAALAVAGSGPQLAGRNERGMVSAEWAVGIVAAIAIAGVLLAVVTTGSVQDALLKFILWVIQMFTTIANTR